MQKYIQKRLLDYRVAKDLTKCERVYVLIVATLIFAMTAFSIKDGIFLLLNKKCKKK